MRRFTINKFSMGELSDGNRSNSQGSIVASSNFGILDGVIRSGGSFVVDQEILGGYNYANGTHSILVSDDPSMEIFESSGTANFILMGQDEVATSLSLARFAAAYRLLYDGEFAYITDYNNIYYTNDSYLIPSSIALGGGGTAPVADSKIVGIAGGVMFSTNTDSSGTYLRWSAPRNTLTGYVGAGMWPSPNYMLIKGKHNIYQVEDCGDGVVMFWSGGVSYIPYSESGIDTLSVSLISPDVCCSIPVRVGGSFIAPFVANGTEVYWGSTNGRTSISRISESSTWNNPYSIQTSCESFASSQCFVSENIVACPSGWYSLASREYGLNMSMQMFPFRKSNLLMSSRYSSTQMQLVPIPDDYDVDPKIPQYVIVSLGKLNDGERIRKVTISGSLGTSCVKNVEHFLINNGSEHVFNNAIAIDLDRYSQGLTDYHNNTSMTFFGVRGEYETPIVYAPHTGNASLYTLGDGRGITYATADSPALIDWCAQIPMNGGQGATYKFCVAAPVDTSNTVYFFSSEGTARMLSGVLLGGVRLGISTSMGTPTFVVQTKDSILSKIVNASDFYEVELQMPTSESFSLTVNGINVLSSLLTGVSENDPCFGIVGAGDDEVWLRYVYADVLSAGDVYPLPQVVPENPITSFINTLVANDTYGSSTAWPRGFWVGVHSVDQRSMLFSQNTSVRVYDESLSESAVIKNGQYGDGIQYGSKQSIVMYAHDVFHEYGNAPVLFIRIPWDAAASISGIEVTVSGGNRGSGRVIGK